MNNVKTLRKGSAGPQVELVQLALGRLGFYPSDPDGIFGKLTERALTSFQRSFSLKADGVVGSRTMGALMPYLLGYSTVTVKRGDTLYSLASSHYTSIRAIETANPGVDPFDLIPGSRITVPYGFSAVPTNISYTSAATDIVMRALRARYPFLSGGSAGRSVLGRPLGWLAVGSGGSEVFYNAAHHANEWITTPLLLKFIEEYAEAYSSSSVLYGYDAGRLYSSARLYVMPQVNPDGVDLVTGELGADSEYYYDALAMNDPPVAFPSGWKANIAGVDLNLQYPAGWENARRIKFAQGYTSPGPRDYVGDGPLSQPESRAVYAFTLAHDFVLSLSYHTQGKVIYWKYDGFDPPGARSIALELGRLSGYAPELTPPESAWAGYKDWFILQYDRPGFTIEAGSGVSPLPLSQFGEIYADNLPILAYALAAAQGLRR
ncbi:MAG: peptidoglycan-binding protein [Oscillospiraceae bacterium]|nr:peptidoglycan-binding protein [Oscillospiraceae bacterium]